MTTSKKQRQLQEKERQRRLEIVQGWLSEKNAVLVILQVNRSHFARLVEWLQVEKVDDDMMRAAAAASDKGELPSVVDDTTTVLHIDKTTTLLLLQCPYQQGQPRILRHKISNTWYVKSHVQRILPVEKEAKNSIFQGSIETLAARILQSVKRQLVLEEEDEKEGTSSDAKASPVTIIIRLHTFPVRLERPLLQELWRQIDDSNAPLKLFDFAQEDATHTLAVVRVYGDSGNDDGSGVCIMGSLESLSTAAALPQTGATPQEQDEPQSTQTTIQTHDKDHHDDWRIALYYIYLDIEVKYLPDHVTFHQQLCERLNLKGRIRVSHEGVNGVLSGLFQHLQQYERAFDEKIAGMRQRQQKNGNNDNNNDNNESYPHRLDMKYCHLRTDLSVQEQLFDALVVKQTKTVISLFDNYNYCAADNNGNKKKKKNRYQRRKQRDRNAKQQQQQQEEQELGDNDAHDKDGNTAQPPDTSLLHAAVMGQPLQACSSHLSACEWNRKLDAISCDNQALLLDARNCYESRVGHFQHTTTPTLLTNTRKYSDLPLLLQQCKQLQDPTRQHVFMYCTGGVRCERVSMLVKELYPDKHVYQLKGGIQTYLREVCASAASEVDTSTIDNGNHRKHQQYFVGKNFVFDPRRTDPVHFGQVIGKCLVCGMPHDDYDNGHAPNSGKEARCNGCRMLILLCNKCRPDWTCHGEDEASGRPKIYCKVDHCNHEGAAPEPEFVVAGSQKATLLNNEIVETKNVLESASDATAVNRAFWKLKEAWERFQHHETVKALQGENTYRRPVIAVDCGAAPGGWTQFLVDEVGCDKVYAIDPAAFSNAVTNNGKNAHKICHLAMKADKAIPLLANELCDGNGIVAPSHVPISFWVCDVNARDESFVVDTLLEAADCELIGRGTMFVLTIKCAHGHTAETYDQLVDEQMRRLRNSNNGGVSFDDIQVLHLFSNRVRERTVLGVCK